MNQHALIPAIDVVCIGSVFSYADLRINIDLQQHFLNNHSGILPHIRTVAIDLCSKTVLVTSFFHQFLCFLEIICLTLHLIIIEGGTRQTPLVRENAMAIGYGIIQCLRIDRIANSPSNTDIRNGGIGILRIEAQRIRHTRQLRVCYNTACFCHLISYQIRVCCKNINLLLLKRHLSNHILREISDVQTIQLRFTTPVVCILVQTECSIRLPRCYNKGAGANGILCQVINTVLVKCLLGNDIHRVRQESGEHQFPISEMTYYSSVIHGFSTFKIDEIGFGLSAIFFVVVQIPCETFSIKKASIRKVNIFFCDHCPGQIIFIGCDAFQQPRTKLSLFIPLHQRLNIQCCKCCLRAALNG